MIKLTYSYLTKGEFIMKIITQKLDLTKPIPKVLENLLKSDNYSILDIETTGLSSKYHQVILIGLLIVEKNKIIVKQFFAENTKDEKNLLLALLDATKDREFTITFNGASFDIPFLRERFQNYQMQWPFNDVKHLDLLQLIRRYKSYLQLDNYQLKTVERFLGINRKDTINGKESVALYRQYLLNPSPSLEKTILLHNFEDIFYLLQVTRIFDFFPPSFQLLNKTLYSIPHPRRKIDIFYFPEDLKIKGKSLHLKGKTNKIKDLPKEVHFTQDFNFIWTPEEGFFSLELFLEQVILPSKERVHCFNLNKSSEDLHLLIPSLSSSGFLYEGILEVNIQAERGQGALIELLNFIMKGILEKNPLK